MKKILVMIYLVIGCLTLAGCDSNRTSLPRKMPDNFAFSLTFSYSGSYDSKTGVLKNGYNFDLNCDCETILKFSEEEMKEIYEIFRESFIDRRQKELTVSDNLVKPSYDIKISIIAGTISKNITIHGATSITVDEWKNSKRLGEAYYKIVDDYIMASNEFKSLPENQVFYD